MAFVAAARPPLRRSAATRIGVYLVDTDDGPALFDCGPSSTLAGARGRARRARPRADATSATCCSPTSTSTTRARPARSSARHPELTVWVSRDRRTAPRRPVAARALGASPLRRRFRPALGRARRRCPRANVRVADGDVLGWECVSDAAVTRPTTSATSATARCSRATRPASGCPARPTSCRSRRRPTSTSRRGTTRSHAIRARDARAARADPLRRPRGRRRRTSTGSTPSSTAGPRVCATAWSQEAFVAAARADAGEDAEDYDRVAPFWQSWHGLQPLLGQAQS